MKSEELKIISVAFPSSNSVVMFVKNAGSYSLKIVSVTINGTARTPTYGPYIEPDGTIFVGASGTITISNWAWTNSSKYEFMLVTAKGNHYPYTTTASLGGVVPTPQPGVDLGPDSVDLSPLIVPSAIEIALTMAFVGAIVLNRKQYLNIPAPALAFLGMLMILGLLVMLWLFWFIPLTTLTF